MLAELDRLIDQLSVGTPVVDGDTLSPLRPLIETLLLGPAPREALLNLRKVMTAQPKATWLAEGKAQRAMNSILSSGPELTRLLVKDPRRLELLVDPQLGQVWSIQELSAALDVKLKGCTTPQDLARALTAFRNDHYIRLAACEFDLSTLEQVGLELSNLADLCLDRAITFCLTHQAGIHGDPVFEEQGQRRPCGLTAIAMGKYGAQELNFCSDIDLIFLYESDEGEAGALTLNEFFSRVCQQVTRLLSEPNDEGFSFRVDLRLRPEGSRGPICNSLAGAERYYETWGGPYDRLAWLKARSAAGDLALGQQMVQLLNPFVFPRSLRPEVIGQLQELDRRIKAQQRQLATPGWNVKLERGGIREVEFFVQALQLLHAGKQPALQQRGTLAALDRLLFAGLITEQEHRQLGEAYEFWRRIEHRLQLSDGRQTHQLPPAGPARERLALHLGYPPLEFEQAIAQRQNQVHQIYGTLSPKEQGVTQETGAAPEGTELLPLLDPDLPEEQAHSILKDAGVIQTSRATEQLQVLTSKPWGPLGRVRVAESSTFALALLTELFASPDPDAALHHITDLTLRLGPLDGLWSLLEESRPTLRLLCSLLGSSDYLARLLIRSPELLDGLLLGRRDDHHADPQVLCLELSRRLDQLPADDLEAQLQVMHRFREEEVLRIGTQDIAGVLKLEEVWSQLSDLAMGILQQIYPAILKEMIARYGTPRQEDGTLATMVVVGLGKLGARELTYGSDLDLIFIYSEKGLTDGEHGIDNGEFFTRLAQRIIRLLSMTMEQGSLYQVDTRLRPSGQQGTLVSSWAAFCAYHQAAQIWERQVLIKARPVCGDLHLGDKVHQWLSNYIYTDLGDSPIVRQEIHRLRRRIEEELAGERTDFYNLKLGSGGLLDIEFIVQFYQMTLGEQFPSLKVPSTLAALEVLRQESQITEEAATALIQGYRFLRRIEGRLRIVRDRSAEHLPSTAEGLEVMARRLRYRRKRTASAGQQLLQDYQTQTEAIRTIYREVFEL